MEKSITIIVSKSILELEFSNNFKGLKLLKQASEDGYVIHYYEPRLNKITNKFDKVDILTHGYSYSTHVANRINEGEKLIILYYTKVASNEDIKLMWDLIDSDKHLSLINLMKSSNDDIFDLVSNYYYIAECKYSEWTSGPKKKGAKSLFRDRGFDIPVGFIANRSEPEILTSKPNEKYHGFVYTSKKYLQEAKSIIEKHTDIFTILPEPIKIQKPMRGMMFIDYKGCYDRFKQAMNIPDEIDNAEGMIDMGFID